MSNVKLITANKSNKQAQLEWDDFLQSIRNSTPIDHNETPEQKAKRIKHLEKQGNQEEWIKYYFPKYCKYEPAAFQKRSFNRILNANKKFYQRRAWARGLSKTTRRMFEIFYLKFVKRLRINMLLISKNYDNAERLLDSYMVNLEGNQRLIADYGIQEKAGNWTHGEFKTRDNSTFRAVGAGQNPRGAKNEELRVNVIVFDDVDDDEVCRNQERIQLLWNWIEQAVIPTVDISSPYYIFVDNNIIANDSIAVRAAAYATDVELVNIRDQYGNSTWPEKNSEEDIDAMLASISYESGQKEYFNNPIEGGTVFKELVFGKCPPLNKLAYVVAYADPSPSNKDRPNAKAKIQNSCKAVVLIGYLDLKFYVYKAFVDNTTNSNFVDWLYAIRDLVGDKAQLYTFIENNTLQDPFYEQVLLPLIYSKGKDHGSVLGVTPDDRKKPDKYFRIEGTLEPLNRLGLLVLNESEKEDPHMKRLEAQFKSVSANSKTMDGPDAVEGGVYKAKNMVLVKDAGGITSIKRKPNKHRF